MFLNCFFIVVILAESEDKHPSLGQTFAVNML